MSARRQMLVMVAVVALGLFARDSAWAQPIPPLPFPIPTPTPTPTPNPSAIVFPPFDPAACVGKPQRLLIFDMKSGWWSGDGGVFHNVLLPRIVKDCSAIEIEYYFLQDLDIADLPIPVPGFEGGIQITQSFYPERPGVSNDQLVDASKFITRPWHEYAQVWLLSGSNDDPTDVKTDHEFFGNMLTKYTTAIAPGQAAPSLFIGSGIGNRDHGNRVLATLQLPELFQTHLSSIDTPGVSDDGSNVATRSRARVGAELSPHAVFDGVESIADTVAINDYDYETDFLPVANNPFTIVGKNGKGEPAIGVRETADRRMVVDAGLPRYYSTLKPDEAGTYRYIQNLIKWLAR